MIKEFIIKMRDDNEQKIDSLESEMSELVRDLSCAEQLLEKMIREKKSDTYIFSPRTMDFQIDEKIRTKQSEIRELNQKIDYVRALMEERLKNREEYNKLLEEIEKGGAKDNSGQMHNNVQLGENDSISTGKSASLIENNPNSEERIDLASEMEAHSDSIVKENIVSEPLDQESQIEKSSNSITGLEVIELDRNKLISFLQTIYKDSESCLALMNGNKNRCKSELRKLIKTISEYKKMIETGEI